jgi:cysteine desulfurase
VRTEGGVRIYLDHNAGAPLRPEARAAMIDVLAGPPANPSSAHREGARARRLIEEARASVATLIGARPADVVFTSGATEANNLALRGVLSGAGERDGLVVSAIEHASVLETAHALAAGGVRVTVVPVDRAGCVEPGRVAAACDERTALVSVGLANGEVGSVAPLAEIAQVLRGRGVALHTDAAQAAGRLPVDVGALGVDLLSLSSHKLGGPPGVGALWVRPGTPLRPLLTGGPQERGRRAGTEPVAAIAGFGAAARASAVELPAARARMAALLERLWQGLVAAVPDVARHGPVEGPRLPNTLNVRVPGCAGESLLVLLDLAGVAASLGSACAAGAPEPSHVLRAMGLDGEAARNGLRLSLGPDTTTSEIDAVVELLPRLVHQIRATSRTEVA